LGERSVDTYGAPVVRAGFRRIAIAQGTDMQ